MSSCYRRSLEDSHLPRVLLTDKNLKSGQPKANPRWNFPTPSRHDVEKEALDKASINALEKAFGTVMIRGNSTYMKNLNTGKESETSVVFNTIANTYVKGEVVEVLGQEFEEVQGIATIDGKKKVIRELKCTANFRVRELTDDVPDFEAFPLQCPDPACRTTEFKDKGSLFLHFKSPYDGFLAVYLDNGTTAQCLLPYSRMTDNFSNGIPVKGGKDYLFFSRQPDFSYFDNNAVVDEYELSAESSLDQTVFSSFSPTPLLRLLTCKPALMINFLPGTS